jgi:hypothetical protein
MTKGNFEQFIEALGAFESGKPSGANSELNGDVEITTPDGCRPYYE